MSKKIITVFGATGNQGGSIVNIFLNDPKLKNEWTVRGVTRDATTDRAKALAAKGAKVVSANLDDKDSLVKAISGSSVVFGVTNYWEKMDKDVEVQQGKNLADAAKEAGIDLYIWSSLPHVTKLTNGRLSRTYHYDSKADVEEYVRKLGIPAAFLQAGAFMSNMTSGALRKAEDRGGAWTVRLPIRPEAEVPFFAAAEDTGKFVKGIVLHRDEVLGKQILAATSYRSHADLVEAFKSVYPEAGATAEYQQVPAEVFRSFVPGPDFVKDELMENMLLMDDPGYFGGASLDESHAIVEDKLTTLEEFFKNAKEFADLK